VHTEVPQILALFCQGMEHFNQAQLCFARGPLSFYLERIEEYVAALFERAPWQPGDKVRLKHALDGIAPGHGWYGYRDTFMEGATGVVKSIDYRGRLFVAYVEFDRTFGRDDWTEQGPVEITENKGLFLFSESDIEKVPPCGGES
jgi:hypothetical protein